MSRALGGLRRLVQAPVLWIATWVLVVTVAGVAGVRIRAVVATALHPFDALDLDRVVFATIDALRDHPGIGAEVLVSLITSGVVGALTWTVLSPLLITRLGGKRPLAELGARALSKLPPVVVQSLWHLVLRALLVLAVVLSLPASTLWLALPLAWLLAGVALDATRVAVVEHDAASWHPRTAWRGLVRAVRRPGLLLPCMLLGLAQLGITAAILWLALSGYGAASLWPARALALVSVGLGLWRIGTVVEDAASDPPATAQTVPAA